MVIRKTGRNRLPKNCQAMISLKKHHRRIVDEIMVSQRLLVAEKLNNTAVIQAERCG